MSPENHQQIYRTGTLFNFNLCVFYLRFWACVRRVCRVSPLHASIGEVTTLIRILIAQIRPSPPRPTSLLTDLTQVSHRNNRLVEIIHQGRASAHSSQSPRQHFINQIPCTLSLRTPTPRRLRPQVLLHGVIHT